MRGRVYRFVGRTAKATMPATQNSHRATYSMRSTSFQREGLPEHHGIVYHGLRRGEAILFPDVASSRLMGRNCFSGSSPLYLSTVRNDRAGDVAPARLILLPACVTL